MHPFLIRNLQVERHRQKIENRKNQSMKKKELSVFDKHQLKIAKDTLKMNDVFINIMGGMTKKEAKAIIKKLS